MDIEDCQMLVRAVSTKCWSMIDNRPQTQAETLPGPVRTATAEWLRAVSTAADYQLPSTADVLSARSQAAEPGYLPTLCRAGSML